MTRKDPAERPAAKGTPKTRGPTQSSSESSSRSQDEAQGRPNPPTPRGLTPLEHRFCSEYLVDLNGLRAYQRANPEVTYESAGTLASRLLEKVEVRCEIQRLVDERATVTGVTSNRVLMRLWQMATADARKLIEYRVGSCRHCWGMYNQYHYTEAEFSAAQDKHIREEANRGKAEKADFEPRPFPEKGGPGFDPNRPPNPECPECWGDGKGRTIVHDTRELEAGEAMMYAGIKVTKDSVDVRMHSPFEALQLIGRHLGMWNDKVKPPEEENPLTALIKQIQQEHSTLPIVHDDPERLPRGDVQDVQAKPAKPPDPGSGSQRKAAKTSRWRAAK